MTTLVMLVGLPASGKSTISESLAKAYGALIVSSDNFIEEMAKLAGQTYNEAFRDNIKGAEKHVLSQVNYAVKNSIPIIWDQTNLSKSVRKKRMAMIPTEWKRICIDVKCKSFEEWKHRLMNRPGKTIPVNVIETMRQSYEKPTVDEGFLEVQELLT